ncbi:hypothetical protein ACJQWK_10756 [Exserohilum turcicum]
MTESQTGTAQYPDVEPEDFARFVEYAYRHDYTVPCWAQDETYTENEFVPSPPADKESCPAAPKPVPEPVDTTRASWRPFSHHQRRSWFNLMHTKNPVHVEFEERNYLTSTQPKTVLLAAFEPQYNTAPHQDFTPVFLAHARLYTFACMRLVDPLKYLALHKLHKTLLDFTLYEQRVSDVVELARYAYQQGEDRKDDVIIDELRKLVVDYMVREVSTFRESPVFRTHLHKGGEFFADFFSVFRKAWRSE